MDPGIFKHLGRPVFQVGSEDKCREYIRNGLLPVPGRGDTVRGGVREKDDGRVTFVLGEAEGLDTVQSVRGGDGSWVADGTHAYSVWEGSRGEMELVIYAPWQETSDIKYGLPDHRGTAELSS